MRKTIPTPVSMPSVKAGESLPEYVARVLVHEEESFAFSEMLDTWQRANFAEYAEVE